jgi:hypothetical protein
MFRIPRIIAVALLALGLSGPVLADVGVKAVDITLNASGKKNSRCPDGNCGGQAQSLSWVGASAGLINSGIGAQETGTAYSHEVCQYLTGDEAATAALSIVSVSGDDPATEGWALDDADCSDGTSNLTHDGGETGSGRFKLRADGTGSDDDDSGEVNWAFTAPVGESGYTFPAAPLGTSSASLVCLPTFHNIGCEWAPTSAEGRPNNTTNEAQCRYKNNADNVWKQCLNFWFDDLSFHPSDDLNEARGSIVGLSPNTTYTIEVLAETTRKLATATVTTLNETFTEASVTELASSSTSVLNITVGGSAETGYVVYDGDGTDVIDGNGNIDYCVTIRASYVILRNVIIRECDWNAVRLYSGVHHVVIEGNTITNWGRPGTKADAIAGNWGCNGMEAIRTDAENNPNTNTIIVQNNVIGPAAVDSNSWEDPARTAETGCFGPGTDHPAGPMAMFLKDVGHTIIVRYNTMLGDATHMFDDGLGGGQNFGEDGPFPNNSDIYGNDIGYAHDDCIEAEGRDKNVRIYENRISFCRVGIAMGHIASGPIYLFRNVYTQGIDGPGTSDPGGRWSKHYVDNNATTYETADSGLGKLYKFHETIYGTSNATRFQTVFNAVTAGAATGNMDIRNSVIWTVADLNSNFVTQFFGHSTATNNIVGTGHNNWTGATNLKVNPTFDTTAPPSGTYTLETAGTATDGVDDGASIPNFNDSGSAWPALDSGPDIGAVERGQTAPVYGPR